jgi:hypothetical protein
MKVGLTFIFYKEVEEDAVEEELFFAESDNSYGELIDHEISDVDSD